MPKSTSLGVSGNVVVFDGCYRTIGFAVQWARVKILVQLPFS
jgi:hypothetical protein